MPLTLVRSRISSLRPSLRRKKTFPMILAASTLTTSPMAIETSVLARSVAITTTATLDAARATVVHASTTIGATM